MIIVSPAARLREVSTESIRNRGGRRRASVTKPKLSIIKNERGDVRRAAGVGEEDAQLQRCAGGLEAVVALVGERDGGARGGCHVRRPRLRCRGEGRRRKKGSVSKMK